MGKYRCQERIPTIVTTTKGSTRIERQCNKKAARDGYCQRHLPQPVAPQENTNAKT